MAKNQIKKVPIKNIPAVTSGFFFAIYIFIGLSKNSGKVKVLVLLRGQEKASKHAAGKSTSGRNVQPRTVREKYWKTIYRLVCQPIVCKYGK
jgi:hypothetical protein